MSKIENAKTDRVLRDDELDTVSGGLKYAFYDCPQPTSVSRVVRLMETEGIDGGL